MQSLIYSSKLKFNVVRNDKNKYEKLISNLVPLIQFSMLNEQSNDLSQ